MLSKENKIRIVFSLTMGIITTGLISFALIAVNIGFTPAFLKIWLKSWLIAYLVVIPAILFIAPSLQKYIDSCFD
jgi:hypothetical protein